MTVRTSKRPRRRGSVRGDLLGYAAITVLFIIFGVIVYRRFTTEDPPVAPATRTAAATTTRVPPSGFYRPARPLESPPPVEARRVHTRTLAQDQAALAGRWIKPPQTEVKGGPRQGMRLRFNAERGELSCERLTEKDPPLVRERYRYEVVEYGGERYLRLTDLADPQGPVWFVSYFMAEGVLTLDGERTGRVEQDKLVLDEPGVTELLGDWQR